MAEVLKDEFIHNQSQRDTVNITAQLENKAEATIELSASFLAHVTESIAKDQSTHAHTALLLNMFKYFTSTYLQILTEDILAPLVTVEEASTYYMFGLDVVSWLSGATACPAVSYLASVPISLPLIKLTQLVQYLVICHVTGLTPSKLHSRLSGAMGHSKGIVSTIVITALGTFEEFFKNSHKAIKWLFYSGLRGQQAFPVTSVEPSIVQDSIVGGEGTPSPMLSIAGSTLKEL